MLAQCLKNEFEFELTNSHVVSVSFCEGKCRKSVEEYRRKIREIHIHRDTFPDVQKWVRETGKVFSNKLDRAISTCVQDEEHF